MENLLRMNIEENTTLYPFPKDRSGYLHIFGKDQLLREFLCKQENHLAYEVLDAMRSTCHLINAVNVMRKKEVSFEVAFDYAQDWTALLPWRDMEKNYPNFKKYGLNLFDEDDIDPLFMDMLAKSQLKQRDEALKKLYHRIIALWNTRITWFAKNPAYRRPPHQSLPEEFDFLYPYLQYAFQDLVVNWDDRNLSFVAPIFPIGVYQEKTYNTSCNFLVPLNYLPIYELTSVFQQETGEVVDGYFDEDGFFQVSDLLSFERKLCHVSKREWLETDGQEEENQVEPLKELEDEDCFFDRALFEELYGQKEEEDMENVTGFKEEYITQVEVSKEQENLQSFFDKRSAETKKNESSKDLFQELFGEVEEEPEDDFFEKHFEDQVYVSLFGAEMEDEEMFLEVFGQYPDEFFDFYQKHCQKMERAVLLQN